MSRSQCFVLFFPTVARNKQTRMNPLAPPSMHFIPGHSDLAAGTWVSPFLRFLAADPQAGPEGGFLLLSEDLGKKTLLVHKVNIT